MPPHRQSNQAGRERPCPTLAPRALPATDFLPTQLRGVVPQCAKQCLITYIHQEYDCSQNGFGCLCQQYSSKGYTLGELGYICIHNKCGEEEQSQTSAVYNVCDAQTKAVSPTFTALSAPATTSTVSPTPTTTKAVTTASGATTAALTTSSLRSASNSQPQRSTTHSSSLATRPSSSRTTAATSTSPTVMAASMTASSMQSTSQLSGGDLAGIIIAAVAVVALSAAAAVLFICRRRRRMQRDENEKASYDFIDKDPSVFSPVKQSFVDPSRPAPRQPAADMRRPDRDTVQCWQLLATPRNQRVEKEVGQSPDSAGSYESTRSISQLLQHDRQIRQAVAPQRIPRVHPAHRNTSAATFPKEPTPSAPKFGGHGLPSNPNTTTVLPKKPGPSPAGYESTRTLSQLLQDDRQTRQAPATQSTPSVHPASRRVITTGLPERPGPVAPKFDGYGLPANPKAKLNSPTFRPDLQQPSQQPLQQPTPPAAPRRPSLPTIRPPSLSLDIPQSATRTPGIPELPPMGNPKSPMESPQIVAPPPVAFPKSPLRSPWATGFPALPIVEEEDTGVLEPPVFTPLRSQSRDSSTSLLNYYASPEAGLSGTPPGGAFMEPPTPIDSAKQVRRNAPSPLTISRPKAMPQAFRRDSDGGSDTSFESADPDEPTPPEEIQLTPVQESPMRETSPITDLRYPKIPRSVSQKVPRSPPQPSPVQKQRSALQLPRPPQQQIYRAYSPKPAQKEEYGEQWPLRGPITPNRPLKSPSSSLSGSTLAVKRRGSSADLRLEIPETTYSPFPKAASPLRSGNGARPARQPYASTTTQHESPLKDYGLTTVHESKGARQPSTKSHQKSSRTTRPRERQRDVPPRTPDWEPRLTPRKKGDELYLHFGGNTPMTATFVIQ